MRGLYIVIKPVFKKGTLLLWVLLFVISAVVAQEKIDDEVYWRIKTADGNQYIGPIIYENTVTIIVETEMINQVTIRKKDIRFKEEIAAKGVVRGEYWGLNKQAGSYFIGPSAFNLKRWQGYYQNNWIFWNQFDLGITDKVSLGVGMIPFFIFEDEHSTVWLTSKVQLPIQKDNFRLTAGTIFTSGVNGDRFSNPFRSTSVYMVGTLGNPSHNVSMGIGYGLREWKWFDRAMIYFSGMARISNKSYLMAEFFFANPSVNLRRVGFFGSRVQWSGISFNYGGAVARADVNDTFLDIIPWLGFAVPLR